MPMPLPMPNLAKPLPGMENMATMMMKQKIENKGVARIEALRIAPVETGNKSTPPTCFAIPNAINALPKNANADIPRGNGIFFWSAYCQA